MTPDERTAVACLIAAARERARVQAHLDAGPESVAVWHALRLERRTYIARICATVSGCPADAAAALGVDSATVARLGEEGIRL